MYELHKVTPNMLTFILPEVAEQLKAEDIDVSALAYFDACVEGRKRTGGTMNRVLERAGGRMLTCLSSFCLSSFCLPEVLGSPRQNSRLTRMATSCCACT